MKIAYIIYPQVIVSNRSNGVRSQAVTWARMLTMVGHQVDLVSNWDNYDWKSYDIIHLFGNGDWIYKLLNGLYPINPNIHWSPIVDPMPNFNYKKERVRRILKSIAPHYLFAHDMVEESLQFVHKICVRSNFEKEHLMKIYNLSDDKFEIVNLSVSESCKPYKAVPKESFCLHISSISQSRKNVVRLIEAAKEYNFRLVLAGNKGTEEQFKVIKDAVSNSTNIEVLGFITEEEKVELYKRAKVFALPSIQEGVGIVALDAAFYGCEIVLTNIPGPKEYYHGHCVEVNPFDVDDIGNKIKDVLDGKIKYQPHLKEEIVNNYGRENIVKILEFCYKQ